MPEPTAPTLTPDEIDDLIYFSRTNDLTTLQETITSLSQTHNCLPSHILTSAIDSGSNSTLLHYPSANGNLEIVSYLLSLLPGTEFINHQNSSGNTALHWAGMNGHLGVVQALVKANADPEVVNVAGRDAVVESEWSSRDGAAECAVWILGECGGLEKGVTGGVEGNGDGVEEDEAGLNGAGEAQGGSRDQQPT